MRTNRPRVFSATVILAVLAGLLLAPATASAGSDPGASHAKPLRVLTSTGGTAIESGVLVGVRTVCVLSGDGPRRDQPHVIIFTITLSCNGPVKSTTYMDMFRQLNDEGWSLYAWRGPDPAQGTLIIISLSKTDDVCIPATYSGAVDFRVEFPSGSPSVIEGSAFTDDFFIGC